MSISLPQYETAVPVGCSSASSRNREDAVNEVRTEDRFDTSARMNDSASLVSLYRSTRARTESLAGRLSPEDQQVQSMPDASPTKWHRAHTTWFFESFVLVPEGVSAVNGRYAFLFNSYYDAKGPRHPRAARGVLSRPNAAEVSEYRRVVDDRVVQLLERVDAAAFRRIAPIVELGIAHEEQHQELLLTDILHAFSENPVCPAYREAAPAATEGKPSDMRFIDFHGGLVKIGAPEHAFAFDNERPRHKQWLEPFALSHRLVTMSELAAFIRGGGYVTPSLWLSEGYEFVRAHKIAAPSYVSIDDGEVRVFTLAGSRRAIDAEPVTHVSYYEADAIARFLGARLPTEAEWELAASQTAAEGNFVDNGSLCARPADASAPPGVGQLFGDAWEWTLSSYAPYPGYEPPRGAIGEYNAKFMVGQQVLRGGSALTPARHIRATYRNFWHPATRFQMSGIRLARARVR
jgi:ergothioneine biosynthesis protein EgtB